MSRRYNVRRYFRRAKRNAERHVRAGSSSVTGGTQQIAYTYGATNACVIKSIKLDIGSTLGDSGTNIPYVLVVVREGYDANTIAYPAVLTDLYNPTMDVLISGILTAADVEDHKWNMIGRKLKKDDRICLIVRNAAISGNATVSFELNFSILT